MKKAFAQAKDALVQLWKQRAEQWGDDWAHAMVEHITDTLSHGDYFVEGFIVRCEPDALMELLSHHHSQIVHLEILDMDKTPPPLTESQVRAVLDEPVDTENTMP